MDREELLKSSVDEIVDYLIEISKQFTMPNIIHAYVSSILNFLFKQDNHKLGVNVWCKLRKDKRLSEIMYQEEVRIYNAHKKNRNS